MKYNQLPILSFLQGELVFFLLPVLHVVWHSYVGHSVLRFMLSQKSETGYKDQAALCLCLASCRTTLHVAKHSMMWIVNHDMRSRLIEMTAQQASDIHRVFMTTIIQ